MKHFHVSVEANALPDWMAAARRGDREAFEALVGHFQGRVLRLCWRMLGGQEEARDVAQEVFVKFYLQLPHWQGENSPQGWLLTVATRLCLNRLRSQSRRPEEPLEEEGPTELEDRSLEPSLRVLDQQVLRTALLRLGERARAVMVLYYLEEWNCREIAATLAMSESQVKVTLHRSREKMRIWLCPQ